MEVLIKELSHCLWNRCIACQVIRKILVFKSSYRKMETFNLNGLIHLDVDIFLLLPSPPEMGVQGLKGDTLRT